MEIQTPPWTLLLGLILGVTATTAAGTTDTDWHVGCYIGNLTYDTVLDGTTNVPVECGRICLKTGSRYVAVGADKGCVCLEGLPTEDQRTSPDACKTWCNPGSLIPLRCGSPGLYSVYLTAGPYLLNVTARVLDHPVYVHRSMSVELLVRYAGPPNTSLGRPVTGVEGMLQRVNLSTDFGEKRSAQTLTATGTTLHDDDMHTYSTPGTHTIKVRAANPVSVVVTSLNVTVQVPVPVQLQLSLVTSEQPSCVPGGAPRRHPAQIQAVFAREVASFQAAVDAGYNLTFDWSFGDDVSGKVDAPSERGCRGSDCVTSRANHTYMEEGTFNISVWARNKQGAVSDTLELVVVRRELSNLTVQLTKGQQLVATPSDTIRFLVSMVTTARETTRLEVDFGDERINEYLIVERGGRYLGLPQGETRDITLQADYGEGCLLQLAIDHVYDKPGFYDVTVRAHNNNSDVTAGLQETLAIQRRVSGMRVHGRREGALVGVNYTYLVELTSGGEEGVTYTWKVFAPDGDELVMETMTSARLHVVFPSRGTYRMQVRAANLINADEVNFAMRVHEPIGDVSIQLVSDASTPVIITTCDQLGFIASVESGSDIEFEWEFGDADDAESITNIFIIDNSTSAANHTFCRSGTFHVHILASNGYDKKSAILSTPIIVQDPVEGLHVTSDAPTLRGEVTRVTGTVTEGSDVIFVLHYNGTRLTRNGTRAGSDGMLRAQWALTLATGVKELRVVAYNGISEEEQTTFVEVQEGVDTVSIITKVNLVRGEKVVFIALQESMPVDRPDLIYTWTVEDEVVAYTQAPVLERVFTGKARNIKVSVKVHNKVESEEKEQYFQLHDRLADMRLTQGGVKEFARSVNFTLINLPPGCEKLGIYYRQVGHEVVRETVLFDELQDVVTWLHNYSAPGVYEVEVTAKGTDAFSTISVLVVEERVAGVRLRGPRAVPLFEMSQADTWEADTVSGSHLLYDWSIDGKQVAITPDRQLRHAFTSPGRYQVAVNVSNSLGWQAARRTVDAEFPLRRVRLWARPVVRGRPLDVLLRVWGGPLRHFRLRLGDGTELRLTPADPRLNQTRRDVSTHAQTGPTVTYSVRHVYAHVGVFTLSVNVSNLVTSLAAQEEVRVEEPTSGLRVTASCGPIVALGTNVVLQGTVETGRDLTFDWFVTGESLIESESDGVRSTARLQLDQVGVYNVTVFATSALDSAAYVTSGLPYLITVSEHISGLSLRPERRQPWARLRPAGRGRGERATATFTAATERGSGVVFNFDFGDGSRQQVVGPSDEDEATVSHNYTRAGVYTVKVTAVNPLGNVSAAISRFHVQTPPTGCRLRHNGRWSVRFGEDFNVSVFYVTGTDVMVDWDMGDQTEYKNRTGNISHHYNRPGLFHVVVKCYNWVGSDQAKKLVSVVRPILGVEVVVQGGRQHPNMQHITFTVRLTPDSLALNAGIHYSWEFGEQGTPQIEGLNPMRHIYQYYGRYSVHVTALNDVSQVRSPPVLVEVIEPLETIELIMSGEPLLDRLLHFEAYHYKGSNVSYTWNFGDGNSFVGPQYQKLTHIYRETGAYNVTLAASNLLGSLSASRSVFVLRSPCSMPKVTLLEGPGHVTNVTRGQEVKIETDVRINCSITSAADYTWTLLQTGSEQPLRLSGVPDSVFTDPILFIPRYKLSYGRYTVKLKVEMQGTIVYAEAETHFSVVPASLMPVISGGLQRYAQRTETVVVDGSTSYDPDFRESTQLQYEWGCYQLNRRELSCFNVSVEMVGPTLHIPGSAFVNTTNTFVFKLNLYRLGQKIGYSTSQVLEMKKHIIEMTLRCSECEDGLINSDQRLIVEAQHPEYQEDELQYSWHLYIVGDGREFTTESNDCVNADGSSYHPLVSANTTTEGTTTTNSSAENGTVTSTTTSGTQPPSEATSSTKTVTTTTTAQSTVMRPIPDLRPQPPPDHFSLLYPSEGEANQGDGQGPGDFFSLGEGNPSEHGGISEGYSGRRHESSGSSGGRAGPEPVPTPTGVGSAGSQPSDRPTEGQGSRRGSGSGYTPGTGRDTVSLPAPPGGRGQNSAGTTGGGGDPAVDTVVSSRHRPHIVSMDRVRVRIRPADTTTGTLQRALVFNRGVLHQGNLYIIEAKIRHNATGRTGTGLAYVRVNESPSQGQCTLRPDKGTEMETIFAVICHDWKDEHRPIQYEVSYSLGGMSRDIIYQGLNHETTFMLPAGNPARNHTVLVNIAILDSFGARTNVCKLPVKVKVQEQKSMMQEEEDLYKMVAKVNGTLRTYVSKGDNRNARLHANLVAYRLNRLHDKGNESETALRAKIRTSMLQTLRDLPMRDQYEVRQTTSAVAASTAVSNELDGNSLEYASQILAKATQQVMRISDVIRHVDRDIINMAIQGSSNIVAAAAISKVIQDAGTPDTKPVVERTRWSIHNLTQTELNYTVIGETPVRRETDALLTYAGRFRTSDIPSAKMAAPSFVLPSSLSAVLEKQVKVDQAANQDNGTRDCYEMHVVNYKRNPFLYGKGRLKAVDSQVASLTLFTCDGRQVMIRDLPTHDQITMVIPHARKQERAPPTTFELLKHQMRVHELKVSLDPTDLSSLHINIQLQPIPQGRLFPVALLLRPDKPPTPDSYQYKKVFPASTEKLNLFLPAHALNESMTYYLGVVDAHFNGARPRPGEVQRRLYTLHMWRGQCVFWDEQTDDWSGRGCTIQDTSTMAQTDCRCKHLTAFAAQNSLVPNDLDFSLNVDDFFDLNQNPVTFTLVLSVLVVYIMFLVFCIISDNHDKKKGAIVHLIDNSPSHVHTYVITMETGMRRGAGTSARVSIVLHGKEGMSETRELISECGQPLFERNSRDTFIITLPENMGHIWKVQLWHNNVGDSPNWYLSRVIVKDVNKGQTFYFSCEKWFAVEEEDGKVEREIMALDTGLGFAKVLWAKGTQYLTDYHLWFSLLVRPSYSRFTRAQRLTCCLELLVSYMAVNAAWYRETQPEYRAEFGLVDPSWRAVAVGGITALIVLPVNFLLVFLFRRSKIKKVCIEDPPEKKYFPARHDSVISLDSTVRLLQPAVTPSIFDQSMLNWQSLQDWAQRQWAKRYQQQLAGEEAGDAKPEPRPQKRDCDNDQASSGFEDYMSLDRTAPHTATTGTTTAASATTGSAENQPEPPAPVATPVAPCDTKERSEEQEEKQQQVMDRELRRQHELDKYVLESIRSHKPRRFFLSSGCRYVAWVLAFLIIAGCSAITVLYGFRFGKTKSILWLQSLFFSFIQCVFISHPVLVLIISIYTAIKYRNDLSIFDHHDDGVIEQRTNALMKSRQPRRDLDEDLTMGIAARQRSRYLHYARPPQEKQLIEARKKIMKEKKATSVLRESVSVITLLILLFFVAYSKDISTPYRLNNVLKDILTRSGPAPLSGVKSMHDWYQWSQTTMLDALYWEKWYNGQHTNHDKGYVGNSAILGSISLRQLRVRTERCQTADVYSVLLACRHHYAYGHHDTRPYGANGTWRFYESNVTRATAITGRYAHYDGSGYQLLLPNTRQYAYQILKGLETGDWIDRNTRAVMVEFTLYTAPSKLFSSVTLLLEQSPGGGVSTSARVSSAQLFRYTSSFDNFMLACELLLVVVTMYKLHCEVGELAWYQKAYFKSPWKAAEAAVVLLLLAYIACYIYRFVIVYEAVELMRATYHEEFVDVSYIAYWDEILRSLLGFVILLVVVQSLHLFRNRKVFAKFGGVFRKAAMEILYLGLMLAIWVCAYTCLGYALYGSLSYNFCRVDTALTSVLGLLTGRRRKDDFDLDLDRIGSQLFLVSFLIFVVGSLTAYIIAVLTFHYRVYRDEGLPSLSTLELLKYFWNRLLQVTGLAPSSNSPETAEDPTMIPAEFRMAAIESQVDEMLFKMNALTGGSVLPEKPPMYFTDSDGTCGTYGTYGTYGTGDDGISSGGSEVRAFDEDRLEHRLNKIEDNLRTNEPHLAQLLQLDIIGAKMLSAEHENQLRSALEFEIFRRLQVQRRSSADVRSLPSDSGHVVIHRLSSLSGSASSSGGASSSRGSPPAAALRRSRELLCRTRTEMDVLSVRSGRSRGSRDQAGHTSSHASLQSVTRSDALVLQESGEPAVCGPCIPLRDMPPAAPPAPSAAPPAQSAGPGREETRLTDLPATHADTRLADTRLADTRLADTAPPSDAPARPDTTHDSPGTSSPETAKIKVPAENKPSYDFLYPDSSSGSDHEAAPRSTPSKTRNLRKTKSRGKGKGRCRLAPIEGVDELGVDNEAFASESDGSGQLTH